MMDQAVQADLPHHGTNEGPPLHYYEFVKNIADSLLAKTKHRPTIGIICGSGLGGLADMIEDKETFMYKDIDGFPVSTAPGHRGRLLFGCLSGKVVVCMQGRLHPFEGFPMWKVCLPVRVMRLLNVTKLIVTNATGSLNPEYQIGDMMVIKDHINIPGLAGEHPLKGFNDDRFGVRFPPLSRVYDKELRQTAKKVAQDLNLKHIFREGCYAMQCGPTFETVGEARALRMLGGDVAGMSTVHEVIVASHCGMRVFGLSLVTNLVVTSEDDETVANSDHVIEFAQSRGKMLQDFISRFIREINDD